MGLDSEFNSFYFNKEINKRLQFLTPIRFWVRKNVKKNIREFLENFGKNSLKSQKFLDPKIFGVDF